MINEKIFPLVSVIEGEPLASSLVIARGMRQQHASTLRLIRRYLDTLEQFGGVRFEIQPYLNKLTPTNGGKAPKVGANHNIKGAACLTVA